MGAEFFSLYSEIHYIEVLYIEVWVYSLLCKTSKDLFIEKIEKKWQAHIRNQITVILLCSINYRYDCAAVTNFLLKKFCHFMEIMEINNNSSSK